VSIIFSSATSGLEIADCQWPKAGHILMAGKNKFELPSKRKWQVKFYRYLKNSLIIQEQNTKKNHKRVVVLYVIKNHVNLHKL
jgi:hypothetical protein